MFLAFLIDLNKLICYDLIFMHQSGPWLVATRSRDPQRCKL